MKRLTVMEQKQVIGGYLWVYIYDRNTNELLEEKRFGNIPGPAFTFARKNTNDKTIAVVKRNRIV